MYLYQQLFVIFDSNFLVYSISRTLHCNVTGLHAGVPMAPDVIKVRSAVARHWEKQVDNLCQLH